MPHSDLEGFDIRPLRATFRSPSLEAAYLDYRRVDEVRACALAALMGGLAYALAGLADAGVFVPQAADHLATVYAFRVLGVVLCLGSALVVWQRKSTTVVRAGSVVAMMGTLATYSVIATLHETHVGPSDLRLVFSVFALLAFIFFPLPVALSAAMVVGMMLDVTVVTSLIGPVDPVALGRTFTVMLTFAVAGASFSISNHRARRKEFALRRRLEEANAALSIEVERRGVVELELQQHRQGLEQLVTARTEQLRQSERRLVASQRLEAIGQLAGGLAHDFNNLLVAMIGNAQLTLGLEGLSEPAREYQRDVVGAAERASALARDLLSFSRRQRMEFESLDLRVLVDELVGIVKTATGARVEVEVQHAGDAPPVQGARGPIEQLLLNLAINARDAMTGAGRLTVSTRRREVGADVVSHHLEVAPGTFAVLSVEDTGGGIEPKHLERIFEPFFTTKPEGEGTGLGLSVVHGIVRQHHGFIDVWSERGRGTRFEVHFPAAKQPPRPRQEPAAAPPVGGRERLLVVDDEPLVRRVSARVLEGAGYEVLTASTADEALELLSARTSRIDLVVSDMVMPRRSGLWLMRAVREFDSKVPFLFASGYSAESPPADLDLEPGLNLLGKPYQPEELVRRVRELLDRKGR